MSYAHEWSAAARRPREGYITLSFPTLGCLFITSFFLSFVFIMITIIFFFFHDFYFQCHRRVAARRTGWVMSILSCCHVYTYTFITIYYIGVRIRYVSTRAREIRDTPTSPTPYGWYTIIGVSRVVNARESYRVIIYKYLPTKVAFSRSIFIFIFYFFVCQFYCTESLTELLNKQLLSCSLYTLKVSNYETLFSRRITLVLTH